MRIIRLENDPVAELPFLNAGRGPGDFYQDILPVQIAWVDQLPNGLSAIIATGDLQGREHFRHQIGPSLRLLGEWLPQVLKDTVLPTMNLPEGQIGVLLAGDFYTVPNLDKRGGSGDVTAVWKAFGDNFSWVIGIAGNHDTFGQVASASPHFLPPLHFLDRQSVSVQDLTVAGISGIVGEPRKPWRKTEDDFEEYILELDSMQPDMLLMHDGADIPKLGLRGSPRIRQALMSLNKPLVVRGHAHWEPPLAELDNGLQVLNVDARVVILRLR